MKEQLLGILEDIRPDIDFENETGLITNGLMDSLDIVMLVGQIAEEFDIEVGVQNITPDNFNSLTAIESLIKKLQEED